MYCFFSDSEEVNACEPTLGDYGPMDYDMGVDGTEANVQTWNNIMRREVRMGNSYASL
jgi:hypothetical protein